MIGFQQSRRLACILEPNLGGKSMRLLIVLALTGSLAFLAGCELHQVKGEVAGVDVEANVKDDGGDFCPPGQAKKGNC